MAEPKDAPDPAPGDDREEEPPRSSREIGSLSAARLGARFRAFAWCDAREGIPRETPLFIIDGDSLGEVMFEMLR